MESLFLEKDYMVHVYETGPDGKLNLFSLFNYYQDIASDHAIKLGFGRDDLMRNNHFWVLSRIYSEVSNLPSWGENIRIRTWPNGTDKLFALRNFEVDHPDGTHIASGISSWLILDMTTRKIQRPDIALANFNRDPNFTDSSLRVPSKIEAATEEGVHSPFFTVKVSDLDINLHTNNVQYLKWVCDTYRLDFLLNNRPRSAEINYLAESRFGDEISIRTSGEKEDSFLYNHSVIRTGDDKELCRIRIEWENVKN